MNGRADEELHQAPSPGGAAPWETDFKAPSRGGRAPLSYGEARLWTLLRATVSLHEMARADEVAAQVLDLTRSCLGADSIVVCRREKTDFRVLAQYGADPECLAVALEESRRLAQKETAATNGQFIEPYEDAEPRSRTSVCVPITRRTRITGTIYAARGRPDSFFDSPDLDFLRLLADHAAIALDNVRQQEHFGHGDGASLPPASASLQPPTSQSPQQAAARGTDLVRPLNLIERDAILAALREHQGNRTAAAAALRISVRKLQYKIKEYQQQGFAVR